MHNPPSMCAILLAGGVGSRMQNEIPKQLLDLGDKPLARHSFDLFLEIPEIAEIVVVCAPAYTELFSTSTNKNIRFALPGSRRQDSTYNGLQAISNNYDFICVHDAARPFIDKSMVKRLFEAAQKYEAAAVGMPIKFTIKECNTEHFVLNTPDRSNIWEIQTPQIIHHKLLKEGFEYAIAHNLTVTDDVSLVELLGKEVKLIEGSANNLKITIPTDLTLANYLHQMLTNQPANVT